MSTLEENSDESRMPTMLTPVASFDLKFSKTFTKNVQPYAQHSGQYFFKGVKFSPDGRCILSCSNDNILRLFEVEDALRKEHLIDGNRVATTLGASIEPVLC